MPTFGFDKSGTERIVNAVRKVERLSPQPVPLGHGQRGALDYPVPMFPAKLTAASSRGASVAVAIWGATQASTVAETAIGSTETAYDWLETGGELGDRVHIFRAYGSGRLYFIGGRPTAAGLLATLTPNSTVTPAMTIVFRSTDNQIAAGMESSVFMAFVNSSLVPGYSTAVARQYFVRTSTGAFWDSPSTCTT